MLVHSSLASFGAPVEGGADGVIDALLAVVGSEGTVVAPTFGSSDPVFDPTRSETSLGAVPSALWRRAGALRSPHPLASVAALGGKAAWLIEGHVDAETAHGEGTPYHRLAEIAGKILLLGVDQDRSTFLHTAEEVARAAYLRPATGSWRESSGAVRTKTWPFFPGPHRAFIGIQGWLDERGLCRAVAIRGCVARLMSAAPLLQALLERLRTEPLLFITDNPNLPDGIRQRADVLRAELERERFTLAADSAAAGRTVEEIMGNLERTGIRHLHLSSINGVPWDRVEERRRAWYLQGLQLAGIGVSSLRLERPEPKRAAALARDAGARVVVVPSTAPAELIAALAREGVSPLVENVGISGSEAVRLARLPELAGLDVGIAFNPRAFLRAGENPFLTTYTRSRVRLHLSLLYLGDALGSGERVDLGSGLGEIAELVSMLRASSFGGIMVLEPPAPDRFAEEAARFSAMLKRVGSPV